jgi:8-oxo-dGTP pyrophosphatase MutT (NUDIX family)
MNESLPPPRPAATVVVVRPASPETATSNDATSSDIELLLLRRSDVGPFGGMWVFPGGRVDDDDPGETELERARHAAVRETREEVSLELDPSALSVWSHWTPPAIAPKRYTTWFFVARWPGHDVAVDGVEILDHTWIRPIDALEAGLPLAPPTIVTLHELHDAGPITELVPRREPPAFTTVATTTPDGTMVLLWHGDAGYESGDPHAGGPRHRLWMPPGERPRYERSALDGPGR